MKGYFRKRGKTWSFTVDIGTDPMTGKRKQKTTGGFATKKEAQSACAEFISQMNKGVKIDVTNMTMREFMTSWLDYVKMKVQETTFSNYKRAVNARIIPQLGALKLQDLKSYHGQQFVNNMADEGLKPRYIEYVFTVLKSAIEYAVSNEQLIKNPMKLVEIPRPRRITYNVWSIEEMNRFLHFAKFGQPTYYMIFKIACHTGMRRGEILGLRWKDVDLEGKRVSVTQSLTYSENGFLFKDLKTSSSFRMIAIDDDLAQELKQYKKKQNEFKLMLGKDYAEHDLVCCREDGQPIYPRTLGHQFTNMIKIANVPKIRFHDLRHTHATILLRLRENPKIVSERLGHSTVVRTLDTYSHVIPDMQESTADKFSDALKNKKMS